MQFFPNNFGFGGFGGFGGQPGGYSPIGSSLGAPQGFGFGQGLGQGFGPGFVPGLGSFPQNLTGGFPYGFSPYSSFAGASYGAGACCPPFSTSYNGIGGNTPWSNAAPFAGVTPGFTPNLSSPVGGQFPGVMNSLPFGGLNTNWINPINTYGAGQSVAPGFNTVPGVNSFPGVCPSGIGYSNIASPWNHVGSSIAGLGQFPSIPSMFNSPIFNGVGASPFVGGVNTPFGYNNTVPFSGHNVTPFASNVNSSIPFGLTGVPFGVNPSVPFGFQPQPSMNMMNSPMPFGYGYHPFYGPGQVDKDGKVTVTTQVSPHASSPTSPQMHREAA